VVRADFEVGGRLRTVTIEARGSSLAVTLDGRRLDVDVVPVAPGRYSLRFPAVGAQHDVVVSMGRDNGDLDVAVDGSSVAVRRRVPGRPARHHGQESGDGPARLSAPMPGKVVRVLVKPGDEVTARQGLVVVEAMKMENELRASRAGIVREVLVVEGASVEAGAPLVVVG
jgi:biotin carboxyl carrier protein